jgi:hypothetical protein
VLSLPPDSADSSEIKGVGVEAADTWGCWCWYCDRTSGAHINGGAPGRTGGFRAFDCLGFLFAASGRPRARFGGPMYTSGKSADLVRGLPGSCDDNGASGGGSDSVASCDAFNGWPQDFKASER